jgi:hypothetical protein
MVVENLEIKVKVKFCVATDFEYYVVNPATATISYSVKYVQYKVAAPCLSCI